MSSHDSDHITTTSRFPKDGLARLYSTSVMINAERRSRIVVLVNRVHAAALAVACTCRALTEIAEIAVMISTVLRIVYFLFVQDPHSDRTAIRTRLVRNLIVSPTSGDSITFCIMSALHVGFDSG